MKKAQSLPLNTIIIALLVVIVAVIIIFIFRTYITKEAGLVDAQLKGFEDCDCDGVQDFLDDCDFDPSIQTLEKGRNCVKTGNSEAECPRMKYPDKKCPSVK